MHKKIVIRAIVGLLFLFSIHAAIPEVEADTSTIQSYERFALVIGNENYEIDPLIHPVDDARAIRDFLVSANFKVIYAENATVRTMREKIAEFMQYVTRKNKSVAFIYYSGHGVQEKSETQHGDLTNYLMPINNAKLKDISDLDYDSISLNKLLTKLNEKNHGLNIALIDACRTGFPAKKSGDHPIGNISAEGVYIAYATASGLEASDNGLFSKSFIKNASKQLKLQDIFINVKNDLSHTSQRPMIADGTVGSPFYFTGSSEDNPQVLKMNFFRAKFYEQKAIVAFNKGDKDLLEYRKAWLYGLEAEKLKVPKKKTTLEQSTRNQLTSLSIKILNINKSRLANKTTINTTLKQLKQTLNRHEDNVMLNGHDSGVWTLSYNVDGSMLVSGSGDKTIKLWDIKSRQLKQTLEGQEGGVWALSHSPDGSVFVSGAFDGTIKRWDAKSGKLKQTFKGHEDTIFALSYNSDGSIFASGSINGAIKLWDTKSGQLKQILTKNEKGIETLSYSPDGGTLAAGLFDGTIKFWDTKSGKLKRTLKGHEERVLALSYSPDGRVLASGSKDKTIKLWSTKSGKLKQTLKDHENVIKALTYNPNGSVLASGSYDKTIKLWDAKSGKLIQTLKGHNKEINTLSYSPDGRVLASGSWDGSIRLWTSAMLKTQDLFYKYDPEQVSAALQLLWEMGLDEDNLTFVHENHYNKKSESLPLQAFRQQEKIKIDDVIQWLEKEKAYKNGH